MAGSQNTTYSSFPCPLWGMAFNSFLTTNHDLNKDSYRFISRSSFDHLPPVLTRSMENTPLLIRDEYERLYRLISEESTTFPYSGFAIIGHPGIGQPIHSLCLAGGFSYGSVQASRCLCGIRSFAACAKESRPRSNASQATSGLSTTTRPDGTLCTGRIWIAIFQTVPGHCVTRIHPLILHLNLL